MKTLNQKALIIIVYYIRSICFCAERCTICICYILREFFEFHTHKISYFEFFIFEYPCQKTQVQLQIIELLEDKL